MKMLVPAVWKDRALRPPGTRCGRGGPGPAVVTRSACGCPTLPPGRVLSPGSAAFGGILCSPVASLHGVWGVSCQPRLGTSPPTLRPPRTAGPARVYLSWERVFCVGHFPVIMAGSPQSDQIFHLCKNGSYSVSCGALFWKDTKHIFKNQRNWFINDRVRFFPIKCRLLYRNP